MLPCAILQQMRTASQPWFHARRREAGGTQVACIVRLQRLRLARRGCGGLLPHFGWVRQSDMQLNDYLDLAWPHSCMGPRFCFLARAVWQLGGIRPDGSRRAFDRLLMEFACRGIQRQFMQGKFNVETCSTPFQQTPVLINC